MLVSNTLGLPSLLEADNSKHNLLDILEFFANISIRHLLITNVKEYEKIKTFCYNRRLFLSFVVEKNLAILSKDGCYQESYFFYGIPNSNRKLDFTSNTLEANNNLIITNFKYTGKKNLRKTICRKDFEQTFLTKNYDFITLFCKDSVINFLAPHLLERKYLKVLTINLNKDYIYFYAKNATRNKL